ncbi:type II secretion system protein [Sulfurovum sp. bin170]|uniref:type II secretion system protein n=1 Tax=Sulfurovum sp. bin170 TaxID=2695268 RepID=UPI0013E0BB5B|nr:type II secretion system protein [Sulfurovum sp. bin170]NEW60312.1 type II secretion system protein [Sulfurovum sp. bin170]
MKSEKKAFTLIELIVVVMIISLVGFLVFSEAVKQTKKPERLEPLTLPLTLKRVFATAEDIEFFCISKSTDCYIAKGADIIPYEGAVEFGKNLEVYIVDRDNNLVRLDDFGRIKDQKITLRYTLYANRSTSQIILSNDSGVYYLPTYFGEPEEVEDLDSAKELWIKEEYNLRDSGNYY